MPDKPVSMMLGIRGAVCGFPLLASIKSVNGEIAWSGKVFIRNSPITSLMPFIGDSAGGSVFKQYSDSVIKNINCEIDIFHNSKGSGFRFDGDILNISALKSGNSSAILLKINENSKTEGADIGKLFDTIKLVKSHLNISDLFVMFRSGREIHISDLSSLAKTAKPPSDADIYDIMVYGRFVFDGKNIVSQAFKEIFGIAELTLFLGADTTGTGKFACMLVMPEISGKLISTQDFYLKAEFSNGVNFTVSGTFQINASFLSGVKFRANSSFSPTGFLIAGEMLTDAPIKISEGISLGGIVLSIGFEKGVSVGFISTLYIRKLSVFSAMALEIMGEAVNPLLLCAALNKLSIPDLFENLTGISIPEMRVLDFIQINGFGIDISKPFDVAKIAKNDTNYAVSHFSEAVADKNLALSQGNVKIQPFGGGYMLTDTAKMRLFTISAEGKLQLNAQFYFSDVIGEKQFGSYKVSAGIFVSGVVSVFDIRFALLISYRVNDGLVAFAKIDAFDIKIGGFSLCKISGSKAKQDLIPLPEKSIVKQFIQNKNDGVVFFLSAGRKDIQFYFDGRIELLGGLISLESRLMFISGNISLYASINFLNIFKATIKIEAQYSNFAKANFSFLISIDTSGLENLLKGVTDRINRAIENLRNSIQGAQKSLDSAQQNVNSLNQQINNFNGMIQGCINAINSASWLTKAFVAIAKGAEIAAYEIAKAGIYVAIGTATAALEIAKAAVSLAGKISEEVLQLVNGVITAAASLLMIHKMEITAYVSPGQQTFKASISFRAIGKEYNIETEFKHGISADSLKNSATDSMNSTMESDLQSLEKGQPARRLKALKFQIPDHEQQKSSLANAIDVLQNAGHIMNYMQAEYKNEFGEDFSGFQELRRSFADTLSLVNQSMQTTGRAVDIASLEQTVNGMNGLLDTRDDLTDSDRANISGASETYIRLKELHDSVSQAMPTVEQVMQDADNVSPVFIRATRAKTMKPEKSMPAYMQKLADEIQRRFYTPQDNGYINLAKEPVVINSINETIEQFGGQPAPRARARMKRTIEDAYTPRIS
ncbi:MAG: hypothetical protein AB7E96_04455 [Deferribacterales bacterium]